MGGTRHRRAMLGPVGREGPAKPSDLERVHPALGCSSIPEPARQLRAKVRGHLTASWHPWAPGCGSWREQQFWVQVTGQVFGQMIPRQGKGRQRYLFSSVNTSSYVG